MIVSSDNNVNCSDKRVNQRPPLFTQVAVFIDGRVVLIQGPVVKRLVTAEEVIGDGDGEDGAPPRVRPRCSNQRCVIG